MGSMAALVVMLFTGCYKVIPVEKRLLSEEKLIPILKDIHIAEALLTETVNRRAKDSLARFYYGQIFELHQVDSTDFDQSMQAYFTDPLALDSLYQEVIAAIREEKKVLMEMKQEEEQTK